MNASKPVVYAGECGLEISGQPQQDGISEEAVMATNAAAEKETLELENLQLTTTCSLDSFTIIESEEETMNDWEDLTNLIARDGSGLQIQYTNVAIYTHYDSSGNEIFSLEDVAVELLKIVSPKLVYFLRVRQQQDPLYVIPLRDPTRLCLIRDRFQIRLPEFAVDGVVILTLNSFADIIELTALFDEHLIGYDSLEEEESSSATSYPHGLVRGASLVSHGLKRGAEKTSQLINMGTPFVISKLSRSESVEVGQNWRTTATVAKTVTTKAASVTGCVADKIGSATMAIGRFLAPHAQTQGSNLLVSAGYSEENASQSMNSILNFTAGAVEAVATVFEGIEDSVKMIGSSLGESSGRIIEHKYGAEAAVMATDTFETIGNVYTISKHTKILQPKGILKSAVKGTGKGLLREVSAPTSGSNCDGTGARVDSQQPPPPPTSGDA